MVSTWQSGTVEANGMQLHYTRTGGAKPPVVLAHGFSDDGLCWTPIAQALEPDYDVIMVDARGHGRSTGPEQGYGSAEHAADLAGVIAALGLRHPAVLGHSMGADTALALAGLHPDVPGAILLEDPPVWWLAAAPADSGARRQNRRHAGMYAWIVELKRKTREELIADQRAASPTWSEAEFGPWADAKLRFSFNVLDASGAAPVDWPAVVRRVTCPTLLITADSARGALVTPEAAAALQALLPQLQVAPIAGAGHSIHREQPAAYLAAVRAFLATIKN